MGILGSVVEKAKALKSDFDQRRRAEKEDDLVLREAAVHAREQALEEREQALDAELDSLAEREKRVEAKEKRPKRVFWACNLVWGFALVLLLINFDLVRRVPAVPEAATVPPPVLAAPAAPETQSACQQRGVRYYQSIGSYPHLVAEPNKGRKADEIIAEMCGRAPTTAFSQ